MSARGRVLPGVVVRRELGRAARRRSTWVSRAVVLGLPAVGVLLVYGSLVERVTDAALLGELGRVSFLAYVAFQAVLVVLHAMVTTASGLLEEREDATLDVLALTPLSVGQVVWGKVGARLLGTFALVAGGTPVLALLLQLGGVGQSEVVNAVAVTVALAVWAGALAGALALLTDSLLVAVAVTSVTMALAAVGVPGGAAVAAGLAPQGAMASALTVWGAIGATSVRGSLGALPLLGGALGAAMAIPGLYALVASGGPRAAAAEAGGRARLDAVAGLGWTITLVAALVFVHVAVLGGTSFTLRPDTLALSLVAIGYAACSLLLVSVAAGVVGLQQRSRGGQRRRVWGHPVLWRLARSGASRGARGISVALLVIGGGFIVLNARRELGEFELHSTVAGLATWACLALVAVGGTNAALDERRGGTLDLLRVTTLPAATIPLGWVVGVLAAVAPLLAPGLLALPTCVELWEHLGPFAMVHIGVTWWWTLGVLVAVGLGGVLAGLVLPSRVARPLSLAVAVLGPVVPVMCFAWIDSRLLASLWIPYIAESWNDPRVGSLGVSLEMAAAGLFWWAAAVLLLGASGLALGMAGESRG